METRRHDITAYPGLNTLLERRAALDELDRKILDLVAERAEVAGEIGVLKAELGLDLRDRERESVVVRQAMTHARALGLPADVTFTLMECVLEAARRRQRAEVSRDL